MHNLKRIGFLLLSTLILALLFSSPAPACTGIYFGNQDGSFTQARTLEFGTQEIWCDLMFVPRNLDCQGNTPTKAPGMKWKTQYAYVGFFPFAMNVALDGMNEKGLSCGGFFLPGFAKYETIGVKDYPRTITCLELTSWILSTCASTAEVREKLPKIRVGDGILPAWGTVPPLHFLVGDNTGDSLIIEYVEGKLNLYDNKLGVITNSPAYPWHMQHLTTYLGLQPENLSPRKVNGVELAPCSQGSGAVGLPGDFTSPSRFVRAFFMLQNAYPAKDATSGIDRAFHILNQFDIPCGAIRAETQGKVISDSTQWTSASDLKNLRYYFHTEQDRQVRVVDLNRLDLKAGKIKMIKVDQPGQPKEISSELTEP